MAFAVLGDVKLFSSACALAEVLSCYHRTVVIRNHASASFVSARNMALCSTFAATTAVRYIDLHTFNLFCNDSATLLMKLSALVLRTLQTISIKVCKSNVVIKVLGSCCECVDGVETEIYFGIASFVN